MFQDNEKDFLIVHTLFAALCALVLLLPLGQPVGIRMLALVVIYNLMLPLWGLFRNDREWISLWLFALIVSVFQVFPDWFLSKHLQVLVFAEDGLFRFGTVSGYMAGLWTIPIFVIVFVGERFYIRYSEKAAYAAAAISAFILFAGSEQFSWMLPSWYAKNVAMIGHVAVYIVIPEIILGLSAYFAYQQISGRSHWFKFPAAFLVMQLYLGSAVFFYLLIERPPF